MCLWEKVPFLSTTLESRDMPSLIAAGWNTFVKDSHTITMQVLRVCTVQTRQKNTTYWLRPCLCHPVRYYRLRNLRLVVDWHDWWKQMWVVHLTSSPYSIGRRSGNLHAEWQTDTSRDWFGCLTVITTDILCMRRYNNNTKNISTSTKSTIYRRCFRILRALDFYLVKLTNA